MSPLASLSFKDQETKQATVKWSISQAGTRLGCHHMRSKTPSSENLNN